MDCCAVLGLVCLQLGKHVPGAPITRELHKNYLLIILIKILHS